MLLQDRTGRRIKGLKISHFVFSVDQPQVCKLLTYFYSEELELEDTVCIWESLLIVHLI